MPKQWGADGHLDAHFVRRVRNEVDISNRIGRSLNVCYLYGAYETDACVYLVMEHCTGGQLWDR
jgi:calcium-dependent protein kinase